MLLLMSDPKAFKESLAETREELKKELDKTKKNTKKYKDLKGRIRALDLSSRKSGGAVMKARGGTFKGVF
tara:strand:- start:1208 stop:1417 length:210 start_codon:yes stop_codon:yes gene_type:complete